MKTAKTEEKKSGKPEPKATVKVDQKDAAVAGKDPYLLAVLDDIINKDEKKILFSLSNILHGHLLKAFITRSGSDTGSRRQFLGQLRLKDCLQLLNNSSGHPGAIIMMAEAMNNVKDFELDNAVEEAVSILESADIETLLQHVYKMLPISAVGTADACFSIMIASMTMS
ncbi:hypothetical protein ACJRO7_027527 [Eucalyptus globulus]|uniref:Uncharacterized protein n=1 Tax=Eucalyptus globulus TaxID=34317 RepID=A0ABD3JVA6_EUCGL